MEFQFKLNIKIFLFSILLLLKKDSYQQIPEQSCYLQNSRINLKRNLISEVNYRYTEFYLIKKEKIITNSFVLQTQHIDLNGRIIREINYDTIGNIGLDHFYYFQDSSIYFLDSIITFNRESNRKYVQLPVFENGIMHSSPAPPCPESHYLDFTFKYDANGLIKYATAILNMNQRKKKRFYIELEYFYVKYND